MVSNRKKQKMDNENSLSITMSPIPEIQGIEPEIFGQIQKSIDSDIAAKDELRELISMLDKTNRELAAILAKSHVVPVERGMFLK